MGAGDGVQLVECLTSMREALGLVPSIKQNKYGGVYDPSTQVKVADKELGGD